MKTSFLRAFILTFFSLTATIGFSQNRYQIGLKTSTLRLGQFQMEQRFNLNSKFTVFANFSMGREVNGNSILEPISGDTTVNQYSSTHTNDLYYGKVGILRTLSFSENNFFYTGFSIGAGYEEFRSEHSRLISYLDTDGQSVNIQTSETSTVENLMVQRFNSGGYYEVSACFGMNVPISKRFIINCELDLIGSYSRNTVDATSYSMGLRPHVSGGVFYSFGKPKE